MKHLTTDQILFESFILNNDHFHAYKISKKYNYTDFIRPLRHKKFDINISKRLALEHLAAKQYLMTRSLTHPSPFEDATTLGRAARDLAPKLLEKYTFTMLDEYFHSQTRNTIRQEALRQEKVLLHLQDTYFPSGLLQNDSWNLAYVTDIKHEIKTIKDKQLASKFVERFDQYKRIREQALKNNDFEELKNCDQGIARLTNTYKSLNVGD